MDEKPPAGTCMYMCPTEELVLRESEGLLHRLEISDLNAKTRQRKADPKKVVKCFSRSAAGFQTQPDHCLRPAPVLLETVHYLMSEIAPIEDRRLDVYEFMTDRLRAVRQDMTIQRLLPGVCIEILEPMIRFHVLYGYLLCDHPKFDNHLNNIHLQECFGTILDCYRRLPQKIDDLILMTFLCCNVKQPEMVVRRLYEIQKGLNFEILVSVATRNFIRMTRQALNLDILPRAALSMNIPNIRSSALKNLCHAMSSANATFSMERLTDWLAYNNIDEVTEDCRRLGIKCSETYCYFNKKDLIPSAFQSPPRKWWVVERDLKNVKISQLLLP